MKKVGNVSDLAIEAGVYGAELHARVKHLELALETAAAQLGEAAVRTENIHRLLSHDLHAAARHARFALGDT